MRRASCDGRDLGQKFNNSVVFLASVDSLLACLELLGLKRDGLEGLRLDLLYGVPHDALSSKDEICQS